MQDSIKKITKTKKRIGSMAQMVKHLPSKCKILNLNPSTAKKILPPKKKLT
jgi:hypothetical protein